MGTLMLGALFIGLFVAGYLVRDGRAATEHMNICERLKGETTRPDKPREWRNGVEYALWLFGGMDDNY